MTEEQRMVVFEVGEEIRRKAEGERFRIYASTDIIRIQDEKDNKHYRLYAPCQRDNGKVIRMEMLRIFRKMVKERS